MEYKHQFTYIPYILRAKVRRAGPFPPTIATLGASIVRCYCGYGCGCYCGYCCLRLRCICGASAVPLLCAYGVVVFYSAIAVDWLR